MRTPNLSLASFFFSALCCAAASAAPALRIFPAEIWLDGSGAAQTVAIQATDANDRTTDVTSEAKVTLADGAIAAWKQDGMLEPQKDGETKVLVEWSGMKAEAPLKITRYGESRPVSFRLDVEPVLMRSGCNTGSCHGSARGQDGFCLSLFGYNPVGDYYRLTREIPGRRVDLAAPEKSLMLEKATAEVTHTGGECFKKGSAYYNTLRDWIAQGAKDDPDGTPAVRAIRLLPAKMVLKAKRQSPPLHRSVVMAEYSDGSQRDVTKLALFMGNNDGVATINKNGVVKAGASGGAFVFARFDKFTVGSEVIVLPEADGFSWPEDARPVNFVDEAVFARLQKLQIAPSALADDATFLRRASLDLTGVPPDIEQVKAFLADTDSAKREKLIDRLLASEEFTDLWTMKWSEILQVKVNQQNPDTGRSRKAVYKYYQWLRGQISANRPFNQIVSDLLTAQGSNVGTPQANYYTTASGNRRTPSERAEDTAQLFLGTRIQCAQCHNHPFDRWTMDDYYGFTAFFGGVSQKRGAQASEVFIFNQNEKCTADHPVDGRKMTPQYLGGDAADCQGRDPREMLAHWLTSRDNKGFARTLANRAWAQFFGRGIIEPVDDARISNPPSNEELLAALARRLVESDFNMRQLVRDICLSRTYQLSSSASESNAADDRYFSRSYVRRLQAEVLMDTIGKVTGAGTQLSGQMPGTRAVQLFDGGADKEGFLRNFGASKRETVCACEVRTEPTLTQTLALINGGTLDGALQRSPFLNDQGSAATPPPPEQVIEEIFLRALARKPTDPERSRMLDAAGAVNMSDKTARRRFYEDILWGVMNSTEFAFNH